MLPHQSHEKSTARKPYTLTILSGKGGVGKTNTACNLAVTLASYGKKVLLFDADLGLASIDVLLGILPRYTIQHLMEGQCKADEVLIAGPGGINILPASSGMADMTELTPEQCQKLDVLMAEITQPFDFVIIDAPSGIASNVQQMAGMADEILLVTTPEPTAVMDAYAVTKILTAKDPNKPLNLIVNMIGEHDKGERISAGFHEVVSRFLDRQIETIGQVPYDIHVPLAVRRQQAYSVCFPDCPAARCIRILTLRLLSRASGSTVGALATANPWSQTGSTGVNRISSWLGPKK